MDVCHPYRVPAEPDQEHAVDGDPGAQTDVPQPRHPRHRDLQIRLPRRRRIRRLALADLQFRVYDPAPDCGHRRVQQGPEEFYGYGVSFIKF